MGGQGGPGRTPDGLTGADLTGADLTGADLTGADLTGADLTGDVRAAYAAVAAGWAAGPEQLYAPLARALVGAAPVPVAGRRVLDLGAGTGVAGQAALAAGADRVVAADLTWAMLRGIGPALYPVAGDAASLPFRDLAFDLVVAAFCLSHLDRPGDALHEIRRVGRGLAASTFAPGWTHPAKLAVDEALRPFGFRPPAWHERMKRQDGLTGQDPGWLSDQAADAGFADVRVHTIAVPTGLSSPAQLTAWRLGLAHVAPFLQSLDPARRAAARRAAEQAVAGQAGAGPNLAGQAGAGPNLAGQAVAGTGSLVVSMVVLTAR